MKHTFLVNNKFVLSILIVFLNYHISNAQEINNSNIDTIQNQAEFETKIMKNELKLNLAYLPFGYIEAAFERILKNNTSIGFAFGKSIKKDIEINYHIFLFYRLFFLKNHGKGIFIEANSAFWKEDSFTLKNRKGYGIGFAVGAKFFRSNNYHGEVIFGFGNTYSDEVSEYDNAYPRIAISIGKRF